MARRWWWWQSPRQRQSRVRPRLRPLLHQHPILHLCGAPYLHHTDTISTPCHVLQGAPASLTTPKHTFTHTLMLPCCSRPCPCRRLPGAPHRSLRGHHPRAGCAAQGAARAARRRRARCRALSTRFDAAARQHGRPPAACSGVAIFRTDWFCFLLLFFTTRTPSLMFLSSMLTVAFKSTSLNSRDSDSPSHWSAARSARSAVQPVKGWLPLPWPAHA